MLYHLLVPLTSQWTALNVFNYITFRAGGAAITALLLSWIAGPYIIRRLRGMQVHQVVREGTPESHQAKGATPTMGGLIILVALVVPTLLWARLDNRYVLLAPRLAPNAFVLLKGSRGMRLERLVPHLTTWAAR